MNSLYTGFPAIIYSGLWVLKKFGILKREIPDARILFLITDAPPAFLVAIENGDFKIEILEEIRKVEDINRIPTNMYITIPSDYLLADVTSILKGLSEGIIQIKNDNILAILGKIGSVF
ncbi:MAG: hypothetical protein BAJALOKI1v1_90030 [Promethearchaeota archaeon]|nr:MAG: hypothetical protein BAJALOKI1v1_90030 [Candidatus Lokiarchaeota archaeon]